ncbi:M20/M25/M40 family metallo-hydrolase [Paramaledivibacter caminithermalis]|jgi:tripeptide aminopeptidase|uniref:Peptidase T-like protein n=1 Tax=Paramaledivibacter caminithermalis (strain DSM 15212 / CIP 107654 / DViRD3) TaxID=1121301 RepID=A0A1M6SHK0_PARC5|nr:M20/M25/M40 family metallo-hydrolase [Paramaledivibacter caminithermalis]SHK43988.1 peptidase T-like protein [Paramaledivibacter caminithermalis DSM 15212]
MVNRERVVKEFMKYVQIDSLTRKEGNFAKFIKEELEKLGLEVIVDSAGEKIGSDANNIIATLKGEKNVEPIMLCCHMDTVTPGEGIKPVIKDDIIYSDGTTILGGDNKAGIAAIIEALKVIGEENLSHGDIEVVFTIAEEGGLNGSKNLDYSKIKSKLAFVLDSGGEPGQIIIQGPAQDKIDVKIKGKPAHAGVCPEEGISAIQVASSAINRMNLLRIDEDTTANIGIIKGGKATNIVCPEVEIKAEARSLSDEKLNKQTSHMVECFEAAAKEFNAEVEIKTSRAYGAFKIDENDEIVKIVKKACENIDLKPYTDSTGGGSDTNILNVNGIKAINLGIGEKKAHTLEEHLAIKDLVNTVKLVLEIIKLV